MNEKPVSRGLKEFIDDFAVTPVPLERRKGLFELTMVYMGCALSVTAWLVGPLLAKGLTFGEGLAAIIIANLLLAGYAILTSEIGRRHGLSTAMVSKLAFGEKGQALSTGVTVIVLLGFVGVYMSLFGNLVHTLWPGVPAVIAGLAFMLMLWSSAIMGFRGLAHLTEVMLPVIVFVALWGMYVMRGQIGSFAHLWQFQPKGSMSLAAGISAVFSVWATYTTLCADTGRYARSLKDVGIATVLSWGVGTAGLEAIALILAVGTGTGDLVILLTKVGLVIPAFLLYWGLMWTSGDNLLWSFSLGFTNIEKSLTGRQKVGRAGWVTLASIIAFTIGVLMIQSGITAAFNAQLKVVGIAVPPVGGVLLAEYYARRGKRSLVPVHWPGVVSWLAGTAFSWLVKGGIPALQGMAVAFLVYWLLTVGRGEDLRP
ncbi:MAG: cytosine permease [Firmicutes bacterium]|nr:cytosine permease [Bacillota bacterium]